MWASSPTAFVSTVKYSLILAQGPYNRLWIDGLNPAYTVGQWAVGELHNWKPAGWRFGFRYYRELGFLAHGPAPAPAPQPPAPAPPKPQLWSSAQHSPGLGPAQHLPQRLEKLVKYIVFAH